jgi:heme exporter protein CcmD
MMEALAMGKYGAYVWTSFALTLIVMVICVWQARSRQARTLKQITARLNAMESAE